MAKTGLFHHVGTFLLFAATILLLITTISAPVIGDIAIMKVTLTNKTNIRHSSVTFGTFGHCILDVAPVQTDQDYCYPKAIGYNPAAIMSSVDGTKFSTASADTAKALTRVMILHPIACGISFIAFILAFGSGFFGALLAATVAALAWLITLIAMAVDFALFGIVKDQVNKRSNGDKAVYSTGMWTILVAMICLFFATFVVLFTCCSARRHKKAERDYSNGRAGRHRRSRF